MDPYKDKRGTLPLLALDKVRLKPFMVSLAKQLQEQVAAFQAADEQDEERRRRELLRKSEREVQKSDPEREEKAAPEVRPEPKGDTSEEAKPSLATPEMRKKKAKYALPKNGKFEPYGLRQREGKKTPPKEASPLSPLIVPLAAAEKVIAIRELIEVEESAEGM